MKTMSFYLVGLIFCLCTACTEETFQAQFIYNSQFDTELRSETLIVFENKTVTTFTSGMSIEYPVLEMLSEKSGLGEIYQVKYKEDTLLIAHQKQVDAVTFFWADGDFLTYTKQTSVQADNQFLEKAKDIVLR